LSTAAAPAAAPSSSSSSSSTAVSVSLPQQQRQQQQQQPSSVPLDDLLAFEQAAVTLFQRAKPSVVNITHMRAMPQFYTLDIHRMAVGQGSGFIWDKNGHVVTNYHVSDNRQLSACV
jgi:S1-C subfamily serine protease